MFMYDRKIMRIKINEVSLRSDPSFEVDRSPFFKNINVVLRG